MNSQNFPIPEPPSVPMEPQANGLRSDANERRWRCQAEKCPAVREANNIHNDTSGLVPRRDRIEALVLADVSPSEIARRLEIHEDVVRAYEETFFNVRHRLSDKLYIDNDVIGLLRTGRYREDKPGVLMKLFCYRYGAKAFDGIFGYFLNRDRFDDWIAEAENDDERLDRHNIRCSVMSLCLLNTEDKHQTPLLCFRFFATSAWPRPEKLIPEVPGFPTRGQESLAQREAANDADSGTAKATPLRA